MTYECMSLIELRAFSEIAEMGWTYLSHNLVELKATTGQYFYYQFVGDMWCKI